MKRRYLLGAGAVGLLGLWALRPADRGRPYDGYFAALNDLLRREGGGVAQLVIDLDRLDANADLLRRSLDGRLALRLATKSLASLGLLDYLGRRLGLQRFMVFQATHLNALARAFPTGDLLVGKSLPVDAAFGFYRQLPADLPFEPATQLTWLVDSGERLHQYAELARALGRRLQVALEIDVGLGRGGFATPEALGAALQAWRRDAPPLRLRGLMGYDAHVAEAPFWVGQAQAHADSTARYRAFIDALNVFADLRPSQPLLYNGAGSPTYPLHAAGDTPLNEVAVGSALLMPRACDSEALAAHRPALWIASPVLTVDEGPSPYLETAQAGWRLWDRNRQRAHLLDGGRWAAEPVAPAGLRQAFPPGDDAPERLLGSPATALRVDDWVFLRPDSTVGLLGEVGELRLLRHGRLVGRWQPLGNA